MTRDRLKKAGLVLLIPYLIIGFGFILWGHYVQDVDIGEGVTRWVFWWALPGLAVLPILASVAVEPPESRIHPRLFHGLVFVATALGALFVAWALWVSFVLAPEPSDDVYRWWTAGVILILGALFVISGISFVSSKEDPPEATRESSWKKTALDVAGGGLVFAGLALLLWAFYVDDADTSEPVYVWVVLLSLAGFVRWVIPWVVSNWKRTLVGTFLFIYTAIVLALAVDALDESEDWRFWTLIVVWLAVTGASWASLHLPVLKYAIEIVLIFCVFIAGFALLWIFINLGVLGNQGGSTENVLSAPLSFMIEVALPAAGMVGGLEIAERLRCWLGIGRVPRFQIRS